MRNPHDRRNAAFILLISTFLIAALAACAGAGMKVDIGDCREDWARQLSRQHDISYDAAYELTYDIEKKNDARVLEEWNLPEGAMLDYYKVNAQGAGGPSTYYDGSAVLVRRDSAVGQAYLRKVNQNLSLIERMGNWFGNLFRPNTHLVLVPVGMVGTGQASQITHAMTGAAETQRVAVVGTEFPAWEDQSPDQNQSLPHRANIHPNGAGRYGTAYEVAGNTWTHFSNPEDVPAYPMYWNMDVNFDGEVDATDASRMPTDLHPDMYADSTGGPLTNHDNDGHSAPDGLHSPSWSGTPNDSNVNSGEWFTARTSGQNWTEQELKNFWTNLLYNRSNRNSLTNYYYENSHGNVTIEGDDDTVIGWVRSGHVLDRHDYDRNYNHAQQPGTPLIRPFAYDPADPTYPLDQRIVRASIDGDKLTVLFAVDEYSPGTPDVYVSVTDINTEADNDQRGYVRLYPPSGISWGNRHTRDIYDARRHQWDLSGFRWRQLTDYGDDDAPGGSGDNADDYDWEELDGSVANDYHWYMTLGGNWRWGRPGWEPSGDTSGASGWEPMPPNWGTAYPTDLADVGCEWVPQWGGGSQWSSVYRAFGGGAQLYNTTFTTEDVYATGFDDTQAWALYEGTPGDVPGQALFGNWKEPSENVDYGLSNRLKTFAYYHHGHMYQSIRSSSGYQLAHLRNNRGRIDDIGGTVDHPDDHRLRPYPFDFCSNDMNNDNQGWFVRPEDAGHTADDMVADIKAALVDWGIDIDSYGYDAVAYLFPSSSEGQDEHGGLDMIPRGGGGYVLLPEKSALTLTAHEFGHELFGFGDLYDRDLYNNEMVRNRPDPAHKMCLALGPYSVMTRGCSGVAVDAYHKINTWLDPIPVRSDRKNAEIPDIRNMMRDPVIFKLPANPYDIVDNTDPSTWDEYYLVENRNMTGDSYFGDRSSPGLYIYHIDERGIKYAARHHPNGQVQVEERALLVAMEQADGLNELENYDFGHYEPIANGHHLGEQYDYSVGDPFPYEFEPTGAKVDSFDQIPTQIDPAFSDPERGEAGQRWSPRSWSHGKAVDGPSGTRILDPGTPTDSFSRVVNITEPSSIMYADLFVEPREIVVENVSAGTGGLGDPDYPTENKTDQGSELIGMLALKVTNPEFPGPGGPGDYSEMSTGDVVIDSVKVLESGTAEWDTAEDAHPAIERAYLYAETNGTAGFQGTGASPDSRIGSTTLQHNPAAENPQRGPYALFESLGYRVPLGDTVERTLYVAYDIRSDAQVNPQITVGAELTDYTFIKPAPPGAVQVKERLAGKWQFGNHHFPMVGQTLTVIDTPDELVVTPHPDPPGVVSPTSISQGASNVEMLEMELKATDDEVIVDELTVTATTGTDFIDASRDIATLRLFYDRNLNGIVENNLDGTTEDNEDPLLAAGNFSDEGGTPRAHLLLSGVEPLSLRSVNAGSPKQWLLVIDLDSEAPIGSDVQIGIDFSTDIELVLNPDYPPAQQDSVSQLNFEDDPSLTETTVISGRVTVVQPNAPPNPPESGFQPTGQTSDTQPTLRWDHATDNEPNPDPQEDLHYEVELATDSNMQNLVEVEGTPASGSTGDGENYYDVPVTLELGTYYWRVRTVDSKGARSVNSDIQSFTISENEPPTPPVDNFEPSDTDPLIAQYGIVDQTPLYQWGYGDDPDPNDTWETLKYELQVDDNEDFSSTIVDVTDVEKDPSATLEDNLVTYQHGDNGEPNLTPGVTYHWRVRSTDEQGTASEWSAVQHFKVVNNSSPFKPIEPFEPTADEEINSANPSFTWHSASPPDPNTRHDPFPLRYDLQVVEGDDTFANGLWIDEQLVPGDLDIDDTEMSLTWPADAAYTFTDDTRYRWRVRARDSEGLVSDWTDIQTFWVNTENDPPNAVTSGFSPNNGQPVNQRSGFDIVWDHATDPDPTDDSTNLSYIVQLSKVGSSQADFEANIAYQYTSEAGQAEVTIPEGQPLEDNTTWYWRVITVDDDGLESGPSAIQNFLVDTGNEAPQLYDGYVAPVYGQPADYFQYFVTYRDADGDAPGWLRVTIDQGQATETTLEMSPVNPGNTDYENGVQYVAGLEGSALGVGSSHTWYMTTGYNATVAARLPASGTEEGPIVSNDANEPPTRPENGFVPVADAQISTTTPYFAWNDGSDPDEDPADPQHRDWPENLRYEFEIARDAIFTDVAVSDMTDQGDTFYQVPAASALASDPDNPVDYYWRVRTVDEAGAWSDWTDALHFSIVTNDPPAAPTGGFWPTGGVEISDTTPRYQWNHATDPNDNDTYDRLLYHVQVMVNGDPDNTVFEQDDIAVPGDVTAGDPMFFEHPAADALDAGTFYQWRVRTKDRQGAYSAWTGLQEFHLVQNRPPATPVEEFGPTWIDGQIGVVQSFTPSISWHSADPADPDASDHLDVDPFPLTYDVQVVEETDSFADGPYAYQATDLSLTSTPALEINFDNRRIEFVMPDNNLEEDTYYKWRVRARDSQGAVSDWSAAQAFAVDTENQPPNAPDSGFDPTAGDVVSGTLTPTLSWDEADDDDPLDDPWELHYIVELSKVGSGQADFTNNVAYQYTTADDTTSVTVEDELDDMTTWYWRVWTVDQHDVKSDEPSEIQEFEVNTNQAPLPPTSGFFPAGGIDVAETKPELRWNHGSDPDPADTQDTLTYHLEIDTDEDFSDPVLPDTEVGPTSDEPVSYQLDAGDPALAVGNTYYWRVRTEDPHNALSDWSAVQNFRVVDSSAPYTPIAPFSPTSPEVPTAAQEVATDTPTFIWHSRDPADPNSEDQFTNDPFPLRYHLQVVKGDTSFAEAVANDDFEINDTDLGPNELTIDTNNFEVQYAVTLPSAATEDDVRFHWRVRVQDSRGEWSDWCATQSFWLNQHNAQPEVVKAGFDPNNDETVNTVRPTLSWQHAEDPDPSDNNTNLTYIVELSRVGDTQADFTANVSYQYTTGGNGSSEITVTEPLDDLTTWFWRVKTVDDDGVATGDVTQPEYSAIQSFYIDTENETAELLDAAIEPMYGSFSTFFEYSITYRDAEGDPPGRVWVVIDPGTPDEQELELALVEPNNPNFTDGETYRAGLQGSDLGYGQHDCIFQADTNNVRYPEDPDTMFGPVVGTDSVIAFTDENYNAVDTYEETDVAYVQLEEGDENLDPNAQDTLDVTVATQNGSDTETLTLTESGNDTGVFQGEIPLHGAPGSDDDGELNVVSGPSGNTIVAYYIDGDDINNPSPRPEPDTATDEAQVEDTEAPDPIDNTILTATSGPQGRSVDLRWDGYDEPAQIDVEGYRVYRSSSDPADGSGTTTDMTLYSSVVAGSSSVTVSGLEPGETYYFAVVPFDEVPNPSPGAAVNVDAVAEETQDTAGPEITDFVPADGETEVELDTTISCHIADEGVGLDLSTLSVEVTADGQNVTFARTETDQGDYHLVEITPDSPFNWNDTVTVTVSVDDLNGNPGQEQWTFDVLADTVDPTVEDQSPADGDVDVSVDDPIQFHLKDNKSGIDLNSLTVELNGTDITADLRTSEVDGNLDILVTYRPEDGLSYSQAYTVVVHISDVAGNEIGPIEWTFDTAVDDTDLEFDNFDPADGDTDVPITTSISLRAVDSQSGVNPDSIRMWVQNTEVTGSDRFVLTPHNGSVTIEYTPADDLPYSTDIVVKVYAEDNVGNDRDVEYSFETEHPDTYVISGDILTAAGDPVAGVTVTITGTDFLGGDVNRTEKSDGNGSYLVRNIIEGNYTVTPTKDEWTFEPVEAGSQDVVIGPDDAVGVDFIGELITHDISGRVTDRSGNGVEGVTIQYGTDSVTTAADGTYAIEGLRQGEYTLTPSKEYYHFDPVNRVVEIVNADLIGQDFTAIPDTFEVTGTVADARGNRIQGVEVSDGDQVAITDDAGVYTLSNLSMGTHQITARKAGYQVIPADGIDYSTAGRTVEVTLPPDASGVDFVAHIEISNSFTGGTHLMGVPGTPINPDPIEVFGTESVARWDGSAQPPTYLMAENYRDNAFMQVQPGSGYFVRYNDAHTIAVAATPTSTSGPTSIGLGRDWNMIANPFTGPTPFANFQPSEADGIRPFGFAYNTQTGSYELISAKPAVNAKRAYIDPWEGMWVLAESGGISLTVTASAGTADVRSIEPQQVELGEGYVVPVAASANGRSDTCSVAGVVPGQGAEHTLPNPPAVPGSVDVYFVGESGQKLARDIRSSSAGSDSYEFVVATDVGAAEVRVALPDLTAVPHQYQVMLTDLDAGETVYARTMQAYTFNATEKANTRRFRLTVEPRSVGSLVVSTASANQNGENAVVTYNVTKPCKVTLRVMNMAGRCVKVIATDKVAQAGVNTEAWNLRNTGGAPVPSGMYLIEVRAQADNGQQSRGLTKLMLNR